MYLAIALLIGCAALGILCCCVVTAPTCPDCTSTPTQTYQIVIAGTVGAGSVCGSTNCQQIKGTFIVTWITGASSCVWSVTPSWTGCLANGQVSLGVASGGSDVAICGDPGGSHCVFAGGASNIWERGDSDCGGWSGTSFPTLIDDSKYCGTTSATVTVSKI